MEFEQRDDQEWERLLSEWLLCSERLHSYAEADRERGDIARDWWKITSEAVTEMRLRLAAGQALTPLPEKLLAALAGMSEYLALGIVPKPIEDVRRPGKPPIGPTEAKDISFATAYMRLCADGSIDDPSPTATICRAYDVKRQTAQKWKHRPLSREVEVLISSPQSIVEGMRKAGDLYQRSQWRRTIGKAPV